MQTKDVCTTVYYAQAADVSVKSTAFEWCTTGTIYSGVKTAVFN